MRHPQPDAKTVGVSLTNLIVSATASQQAGETPAVPAAAAGAPLPKAGLSQRSHSAMKYFLPSENIT